jgi:ubiquinone/menaquinone biosynthesis C-methylase UbiE
MRNYLYSKLNLTSPKRVLEVGCGTGAITKDIGIRYSPEIHGLDLSFEFLQYAHSNDQRCSYSCGDGLMLPYAAGSFDVLVCHFFLLWIKDIPSVLAEMRRVTKKGGAVLALAEPDYGARIDYPEPLRELGLWQSMALKRQGADPEIGRRLMAEFLKSGLQNVRAGLMGGEWKSIYNPEAFESEWKILEADLTSLVSPSRLQALRQMDKNSHQKGERILFVPTFYAFGMNPSE